MEKPCIRCGKPSWKITGRQACSDSECEAAFCDAVQELEEWMDEPEQEELMAVIFFENNGHSAAARWWHEMTYMPKLHATWQRRYEAKIAEV